MAHHAIGRFELRQQGRRIDVQVCHVSYEDRVEGRELRRRHPWLDAVRARAKQAPAERGVRDPAHGDRIALAPNAS